jgi:hypothetical protein
MSNALLGYGTVFQSGDGNSPEAFTALAEVSTISMLRFSADAIDTSHELPPNSARTFIVGMQNYGTVQVNLNFVPGSATETALFLEMVTQPTRNRQVVFLNGRVLSFAAFLIGHEASEGVADKLGATATFQLTTPATLT